MPKIRSHSGAKKRFFVTKRGKVKYKTSGQRHLLIGMPASKGRRLKKMCVLNEKQASMIKKMIPYA